MEGAASSPLALLNYSVCHLTLPAQSHSPFNWPLLIQRYSSELFVMHCNLSCIAGLQKKQQKKTKQFEQKDPN